MNTLVLEKLGLTDSEIKVYLALLRLGQVTAGPIVTEAKVTRSKIYDILERLQRKGLVSTITRSQTKYFSAADPNSLLTYIEKKERALEKEKTAIKEILPELLLQQTLAKHESIAEVFVGLKGMESAFAKIITQFDKQEPFLVFGAGVGATLQTYQIFFHRLHQQRIKAGVKSLIIYNEEARGKFSSQQNSKLVETRYNDYITATSTCIYKNTVVIAILTSEPITVLIHNKEAADSFRATFTQLWKSAHQ
jgi:sugar-specific transcriptional regulator TrmB